MMISQLRELTRPTKRKLSRSKLIQSERVSVLTACKTLISWSILSITLKRSRRMTKTKTSMMMLLKKKRKRRISDLVT